MLIYTIISSFKKIFEYILTEKEKWNIVNTTYGTVSTQGEISSNAQPNGCALKKEMCGTGSTNNVTTAQVVQRKGVL